MNKIEEFVKKNLGLVDEFVRLNNGEVQRISNPNENGVHFIVANRIFIFSLYINCLSHTLNKEVDTLNKLGFNYKKLL